MYIYTYIILMLQSNWERVHLHPNFNIINSHFFDLSLGLARAPATMSFQISGIQDEEVAKTLK